MTSLIIKIDGVSQGSGAKSSINVLEIRNYNDENNALIRFVC